jgi:hypothetical protein
MEQELLDLLPRSKDDQERAQQLLSIDLDKLTEIVPNLLTWLQDPNWWPVGQPIANAILKLPEKNYLIHIVAILESGDELWSAVCLNWIVKQWSLDSLFKIKPILERISYYPTDTEKLEEIDETCKTLLKRLSI